MLEEVLPLQTTGVRVFAAGIEQNDLPIIQPDFRSSFQDRLQQRLLRKHILHPRSLESMSQLMSRIRRVRASIYSPRSNNAKEEDGIPDVVEGVDADAVSRLQADGFETRCQLADGSARAAGADVVGGVEGVDVDLVCLVS